MAALATQALLVLAALAAPAFAQCGEFREPPCIDAMGNEFCTIVHNEAGGRSGPNGNGLCTPCGFSGKTVCNSVPLAFSCLCARADPIPTRCDLCC